MINTPLSDPIDKHWNNGFSTSDRLHVSIALVQPISTLWKNILINPIRTFCVWLCRDIRSSQVSLVELKNPQEQLISQVLSKDTFPEQIQNTNLVHALLFVLLVREFTHSWILKSLVVVACFNKYKDLFTSTLNLKLHESWLYFTGQKNVGTDPFVCGSLNKFNILGSFPQQLALITIISFNGQFVAYEARSAIIIVFVPGDGRQGTCGKLLL